MINSRELVKQTINAKATYDIALYDSFWEDTLTTWKDQGALSLLNEKDKVFKKDKLDINLSLQRHFDFDFDMVFLDNSFRLEPELLKEENGFITVKDRCGYTADKYIGKSRTMHMYNHVNTGEETWKKLRHRLRVDFDHLSRVDVNPYFMRTEPDKTWEESIQSINKVYDHNKYTFMNSYGPFEAAWRHRGFTELLMDSASEEAFIEEMFEAHTDLIIETLKKGLSMGMRIDGYFLIEDLGHTGGLLISPAVYKRTLHKQHRKLGDFLHSNKLDFFMHSCGRVKELIPLFIEEGLDVLQAIESKADQDVSILSAEYGKDLVFMGNIDVQKLSGSQEDIKEEIRHKIIPAIHNGGYIYHSDHSIPPEVSFENYCYMIDLIKRIS
ncbi:MAG: hypothetical protein JXQ23_10230 [Clostridia bacterium]|nr:hypothetical protein [Clostridia bacterium]